MAHAAADLPHGLFGSATGPEEERQGTDGSCGTGLRVHGKVPADCLHITDVMD